MTMMENTASSDITTTGAWQKLLRRNGSWQVRTLNWTYAFTVFLSLFVAVAADVVVFRKVNSCRLMQLKIPCTSKNWLVVQYIDDGLYLLTVCHAEHEGVGLDGDGWPWQEVCPLDPRGLAPEGGAAVVLNARAGVEVEELRKVGMKVVGMFSEGKELFSGELVDSKTGAKWEGSEESFDDEEEEDEPPKDDVEADVQAFIDKQAAEKEKAEAERKEDVPPKETEKARGVDVTPKETEKGSVYETEMAAAEQSGAKKAEAEKAEAERFAASALVTPPEGVAGEDVHPLSEQ
jgi:hypothetical protein